MSSILVLNDNLPSKELKNYSCDVKHLLGSKKQDYIDVGHTHNLGVTGLIGLLSKAYSNHINVSISANDLWSLVISQLKESVKAKPSLWKHLFTDSDKKQEISVQSCSLDVLPTDLISKILSDKVKFDSSALFPSFSTLKTNYDRHLNNLFLDMSSPYYSYSMYCCGIRSVKLDGELSDWLLLKEHCNKIFEIFDQSMTDTKDESFEIWKSNVLMVANNLVDSYKNPEKIEWMLDIFTQKNIGSGPELEINGWISLLYYFQPRLKKIENFSTDIAVVDYKNLSTNKEYTLVSGGLSYEMVEDFIELTYNEFVFTKK